MKYCQDCGARLSDNAKFCVACGFPVQAVDPSGTRQGSAPVAPNEMVGKTKTLVKKLSSRLMINGIIWIGIAAIQIVAGLCGAWPVLIVGVLNVISAILDMRISRRIRKYPVGIVRRFKPLVEPIIVLIYNLLIGGLIGVIGSIYYLVFIRGFVMENQSQFLELETLQRQSVPNQQEGNMSPDRPSCPAESMEIEIFLTHEEAKNGACKEIYVAGQKSPIRVNVPANLQEGTIIRLRRVKIQDENGLVAKKDVFIRVRIRDT